MDNIEREVILDSEELNTRNTNNTSFKEIALGIMVGIGYLTIFTYFPLLILQIFIGTPVTYTGQLRLSVIAQLITAAISVVLMCFISKNLIKEFKKGFNLRAILDALKYAVLIYVVGIGLNLLDMALFGELAETNANQSSLNDLLLGSPILFFGLTVVFAPLIEELIFRYYIFRPFKKNKPIAGYIISGVSFGIIHMINTVAEFFATNNTELLFNDLRSLPSYIACGVILCICYFKTNNFTTNVLAHSFYNLFAAILLFISSIATPLKLNECVTTNDSITLSFNLDESQNVTVKSIQFRIPGEDYQTIEVQYFDDFEYTFDNLVQDYSYEFIINYEYGEGGLKVEDSYTYSAVASSSKTLLD